MTPALTDADRELIDAAAAIIDASTDADSADASGIHTMGAAVRDSSGCIHVGVNLWHFTGGPCAELVALGTARANGARRIEAIVAGRQPRPRRRRTLCRDRQILFDYHPGIRVLLPTADGVRAALIEDLLPLAAVWTIDGGTQAYDPGRFDG